MKEMHAARSESFSRKKEWKKKIKNRKTAGILIKGAGIFLARAMPIPGLAPFGLAFLAMERRFSLRSCISLVMVTIGYLTLGFKASMGYIIAGAVYTGFLYFAYRDKEADLKMAAAVMGIILAVADIADMLWTGFSFESVIMTLLDEGLLCLGILVFDRCRRIMESENIRGLIPSRDEKLCLCIMMGIALLSFRDVYIIHGFSAANVLGFFLLGVSAAAGGLLCGMVTGIIIGVLLGIGGEFTAYLSVFSVAGLAGGLCASRGKYSAGAGLLISGVLISVYVMSAEPDGIRFYEVISGAAALMVIPESFYSFIGRFISFGQTALAGENPYKLHVQTKLALASESFGKLAETFIRISDKEKDIDMHDIGMLFDTAADRVCKSCGRVNECWKKNYNSTYKTMFSFLDILERKRILSENDADPYFAAHCFRLKTLVRELNKQFEIYKLNQIWKSKLSENRELAGEQFSGVAEILNKISAELDRDSAFDSMAAEEIQCRLKAKGIEADKIQVSQDFEGRHRVQLYIKKCGERPDSAAIASALKGVLGAGFVCESVKPAGKDKRMIQLYHEAPALRVAAGYVCTCKSDECGDSHALTSLRSGKYIATLSDGMGTGSNARKESNAIVGLLENFMDAGFDKTVAVKLINSAMVMKSVGEAFATVDMCMIDLYSGEAEFIKNGAEPSYIKRKGGTETVRAASLPVGVMSGVEIESFAHRLTEGDTVVMVSDGLEVKNGHEGWLRKTIEQAAGDIPVQELAQQIMDKSIALKGGTADDDMTVIVLRLAG